MKTLKTSLILLSLFLYACQAGPQPIEYGVDGCHFCKMTIVDQRHASELVTKKGKTYKFDATECMVHFIKDFEAEQIALLLSNDYTKSGELIDATTATFLISENVPSPMGAFLSAFENKQDALDLKRDKGGELFTWEELINHIK